MSFRAFISVDIDPNPLIENFSKALQNTGARLKAVRMEQIHMTLKFLGPTDEGLVPKIEGIMKEAVTGVKPFEIGFKGTGAFPNLNYIKVVWIGLVNSEPLAEVSRVLNDEMSPLGFKREGRGFSPHVTVGRLKGSKGKEMIQEILSKTKTADFGAQTIDRLKLKKSVLETSGPIYSTIAEVPFPAD